VKKTTTTKHTIDVAMASRCQEFLEAITEKERISDEGTTHILSLFKKEYFVVSTARHQFPFVPTFIIQLCIGAKLVHFKLT